MHFWIFLFGLGMVSSTRVRCWGGEEVVVQEVTVEEDQGAEVTMCRDGAPVSVAEECHD